MQIYSSWILFVFDFFGVIKAANYIRKKSLKLFVTIYYLFVLLMITILISLFAEPIMAQFIYIGEYILELLLFTYLVGITVFITKQVSKEIRFQKSTHFYHLIQDDKYISYVRFSLELDSFVKYYLGFAVLIVFISDFYYFNGITLIVLMLTTAVGAAYIHFITSRVISNNTIQISRNYSELKNSYKIFSRFKFLLPVSCRNLFEKDVKRFVIEGHSKKYLLVLLLSLINIPIVKSVLLLLRVNMTKSISYDLAIATLSGIYIIILLSYFLKEFISLSSEKSCFKIYNQMNKVYFKLYITKIMESILLVIPLWIGSIASKFIFGSATIHLNGVLILYEVLLILLASITYISMDFSEPKYLKGLFFTGPIRSKYQTKSIITLVVITNIVMIVNSDISNGFEIYTIYLVSLQAASMIVFSIYRSYLRLSSATRYWYGGYYYD